MRNAPSFERIVADPDHSFRWSTHDFPCEIARWNHHPEHEIHLIRETTGRVFVGDYIGTFEPGHVAFVNADVPHNWVSDLAPGEVARGRDVVLQFDADLLARASRLFPEIAPLALGQGSFGRSWEYYGETALAAARLMEEIGAETGMPRLLKFLELILVLDRSRERGPLATEGYVPLLDRAASEQVNLAMQLILERLPGEVRLKDIADRLAMSETSFSRFFLRNTGHNFVAYIRKLRIGHACRLLSSGNMPITRICGEVGYNNISNFNRSFLTERGMTPRAYRALAHGVAAG